MAPKKDTKVKAAEGGDDGEDLEYSPLMEALVKGMQLMQTQQVQVQQQLTQQQDQARQQQSSSAPGATHLAAEHPHRSVAAARCPAKRAPAPKGGGGLAAGAGGVQTKEKKIDMPDLAIPGSIFLADFRDWKD